VSAYFDLSDITKFRTVSIFTNVELQTKFYLECMYVINSSNKIFHA